MGVLVIHKFDILAGTSKPKGGKWANELADRNLGTAVHRLTEALTKPKINEITEVRSKTDCGNQIAGGTRRT